MINSMKFKYWKRKIRNFIFPIWFIIIGLILGIVIDSLFKYKLIIPNEQFGSIADWVSGLGSLGAIITSLYLASRRSSKILISHNVGGDYKNKELVEGSQYIDFLAYNLSDRRVTLSFNGLKIRSCKRFYKITEFDKKTKSLEPGEEYRIRIPINDINKTLKLTNYKGKIKVCFGEPDGKLHVEKFKWNDFNVPKYLND